MASIGARLDRLPMTSLHRRAIVALGFAYFFEFSDLNTFAYAAPSIMRQWGISLDTVALITSTSFGGMFLGAAVGGMVADRIGRKSSLILAIGIYSISSLLSAAVEGPISLAILRLLTGIGLSSMVVAANTYVSEFFPARVRGKSLATVLTVGLVGIPVTAWSARFMVPIAPWGWRLIFVWGAMGALALIFALRMKESPRWQAMHGHTDQAEATLAALEADARSTGALLPLLPEPESTYADPAAQPRGSFAALFSRGYVGRTTFLLLSWLIQTIGFYGFLSWAPTLLAQHGFSVVHSLTFSSIMAVCNPIGALISIVLIERFDRKWFIACGAVIRRHPRAALWLQHDAGFHRDLRRADGPRDPDLGSGRSTPTRRNSTPRRSDRAAWDSATAPAGWRTSPAPSW